jgi:Putative restriction endonuclease
MNPQIDNQGTQADGPVMTPDGGILVRSSDGRLWEIPAEVIPNVDELVIEDGKPVDSVFVEKQQRLLTEPLYSSWPGPGEGRTWQALADVGLFFASKEPALVPDVMLSLDVETGDLSVRENRSYFVWIKGKVPDVVIDIVSDRLGGEMTHKMRSYSRMGIPHYVNFDPQEILEQGVLRAFQRRGTHYEPTDPGWLPIVELGLILWEGRYEGQPGRWLRWRDRNGQVIPTGRERAEQEKQRAEEERQRAERLAAQLRALGIQPEP